MASNPASLHEEANVEPELNTAVRVIAHLVVGAANVTAET